MYLNIHIFSGQDQPYFGDIFRSNDLPENGLLKRATSRKGEKNEEHN